MPKVIIRGLVRARREVENRLKKGVLSGAMEPLRQQIAETIRQVDEICLSYQTSPAELPTQSRQAYQYLRGLLEQPHALDSHRKVLPPPDPRLVASFERVNVEFFAGQLAQPGLIWSSRVTRREFGSYRPLEDLLTISRTLAGEQVPLFVFDFVMYHELLHKALGVRLEKGRKRTHTPEFHQAERAYPQYAEAKRYLEELAREQVSSRAISRPKRH